MIRIGWYKDLPPELDPRLHEKGSRRVPTNDDWNGTYPDGTVEGSVHVLSSLELRICFWGTDDTGMELNLPLTVEDYQMWTSWLSGLSFISMTTLRGLGFDVA